MKYKNELIIFSNEWHLIIKHKTQTGTLANQAFSNEFRKKNHSSQ